MDSRVPPVKLYGLHVALVLPFALLARLVHADARAVRPGFAPEHRSLYLLARLLNGDAFAVVPAWLLLGAPIAVAWWLTGVWTGVSLVQLGWVSGTVERARKYWFEKRRPQPGEGFYGCLTTLAVMAVALVAIFVRPLVAAAVVGAWVWWPVWVAGAVALDCAALTVTLWRRGLIPRFTVDPREQLTAAVAAERSRYDAAVAALEAAGLSDLELRAGREKAKQQFLKALDGILK